MGKASRKKNRPRGQAGGLYSQFYLSKNTKEVFKAILNTSSENDKLKQANRIINTLKENGWSNKDAAHWYVNCSAYLYNDKTYIYITSERIFDFLKNIEIKKGDLDCTYNLLNEYKNTYIIHFKNKKHSYMIYTDKDNLCGCSDYSLDTIDKSFSIPKKYLSGEWVNSVFSKYEILKVAVNLFLYMDAFPESVKQGPPPVKMPYGSIYKPCTIITESEAIKEVYRNGVTPHMRRGHFRFLQSERYKKKRWQTVYVKPTMVKGHAEHIIGVSEIDNLTAGVENGEGY